MSDVEVNYEDMATAISTFDTLSGDAENMVTLAEDADPDWYTWGLAGLIFVGQYTDNANQIRDQLDLVSQSLSAHGQRIQSCVDSYRVKEEDTSAVMDDIRSRLDGGTWTPPS